MADKQSAINALTEAIEQLASARPLSREVTRGLLELAEARAWLVSASQSHGGGVSAEG